MNKIIEDIEDLHELVYTDVYDAKQFMHSYEQFIKDVVSFYNLPNIDIKFDGVVNDEALGSYSSYTNSININPGFLDSTKMPSKQALDYLFTELIHTAFHEPRHYLQFEYLRGKINLPDSDLLSALSEIEKKKVLEELKNASTDEVLYINDNGELDSFPFFYYSRVHELDAVSTSMNYIKQIIDKLEPDVAQDLKSGLALSGKYWDKVYNYTTPAIAVQKDLRTYETKETIFGLKNVQTNNDDILIKTAMREYLPISKALTEYNLLRGSGLTSEQLLFGDKKVDVSVNNDTWFLHISIPYQKDCLEYCVCIKGNVCCLFRADVTCKIKEDLKALENVFDIAKAFSKVYFEQNNIMVDTFTITPILGIYKEKERQKLLSNIAKIEKLAYQEEPNEVFIRSNFKATNKTPYMPFMVEKIKDFLLLNYETLDKKIDKYEKVQAAYIPSMKIEEINLE